MDDCVFCKIVKGEAPATIVYDWITYNCLAIVPLNPVVPDHVLVLPKEHVTDATTNPERAGTTMFCAAELARLLYPCNIITSAGHAATQTIFHLHIHIVPRLPDDGLHLPWTRQKLTEQQKAEKAYPNHHPETALANYRAGREIWDSNGDLR